MKTFTKPPSQPPRKPQATGMSRYQLRACLIALFPLMAMMLCGAVPAEKGTEITIGSGYNDQRISTGCSMLHVETVPAYAKVRHVTENGMSVTAEGTVLTSVGSDELDTLASARVRVGYQGRYAGLELGPGLMVNASQEFSPLYLSWSGEAWAGDREKLYAYVRTFSGPASPNVVTDVGAFGLGRESENLRLEAELPWYLMVKPEYALLSPTVRAQVKVAPQVWLGADAGIQVTEAGNPPDKRLLVSLTFEQ